MSIARMALVVLLLAGCKSTAELQRQDREQILEHMQENGPDSMIFSLRGDDGNVFHFKRGRGCEESVLIEFLGGSKYTDRARNMRDVGFVAVSCSGPDGATARVDL